MSSTVPTAASTAPPPSEEARKEARRAVIAGTFGSILEWYDYFAYGTAAALVFGHLFFPAISPAVATIAAFATFGVGFFARPLGGWFFSHIGDRVGRRTVLISTLILMGVATALIGCLPTAEVIGLAAPILLVVLRLAQGFAAGGELGGAIILALEHSDKRKRGFNTSWMAVGVVGGLLLSSAVYTVVTLSMSTEAFLAWGWRIPFLLSIVLVVFGIIIRWRVTESPTFEKVVERDERARVPMGEVLRSHKRRVLIVMLARLMDNGVFFIYATYMISFGTGTLGLSNSATLIALSIACVLAIVLIPLYARLSDRIGRKPLFLAGAGFSIIAAFPIFGLFQIENPVTFCVALILGITIGWGLETAVVGAYFAELFPARVRFSGLTLGRELGSIIAGGLAPVIAATLLLQFGTIWAVAGFVVLLSLISFLAVVFGPETLNKTED